VTVGLLDRISAAVEKRFNIDAWISDYLVPANEFNYNNHVYPLGLNQTMVADRTKEISTTLPGYMAALRACPPAFAAQMVRALVLSQARFTFRNNRISRNPGRLFGTSALAPLEKPWPNATTGELLARMEWHAGLAGNAYVTTRTQGRLRVLRPDWVMIVYGSQQEPEDAAQALDGEVIGYVYCNGGIAQNRNDMHTLLPDEVAHWSPLPDPENAGIGMSWITPAIRDIQGDRAATDHKLRFFENGAPQPLDARVLTPSGWSTMGKITVGSQVVGSDGKAHDVVAVYPQGERDIYRVTFSSGAQVECTDDHLWSVANAYDRRFGVTRQMTLAQIAAAGVTYPSGPAKWSVPLVSPVEFEPGGDLPIHPYLLGSLLGDGCLRGNAKGDGSATLACHKSDVDEQLDLLQPLLPNGSKTSVRRRDGNWAEIYFAGPGAPQPNPMRAALVTLGLWGKAGYEKSIPAPYLRAAVNDRIALLQGLIDTDGSIDSRQPNTVRFDNTSETLCRQLADLAGGLGAIATVRRQSRGKARAQWRVTISRLPEWIVPARLARKAAAYQSTLRGGAYRYIHRVESVGRKAAQCIGVDSDDHLYVTDGYVLTHNTPNMVVKGITAVNSDQFGQIVDMMESKHAGVRNAYKTLYLAAGADATVVGSDLKQLDFKNTQGAGETRISMLSRVHPVILGASEGLAGSSLNAGNFGAARRMWADSWIYPTLQDVAAALAPLIRVPGDAELWTTTTDMPILREDAKDAAEIEATKASTINTLITAGFTPESSVSAVDVGDMKLLVHSGMVSVQLQPPGEPPPGESPPSVPPGKAPPPSNGGGPTRSIDDDELDDDSEALFIALAEFEAEHEERAFNPKLHARYPKGHPQGGQFRAMIDLLKDALKEHHASGGKGDPFELFGREQLRKVAVKRGIKLKPGASREDIAAALLADLDGKPGKAPVVAAASFVGDDALPPGTALRQWPSPFSSAAGAVSFDVKYLGADVGNIHSSGGGLPGQEWTAFPPNGAAYGLQDLPGSGQTYTSKQAAAAALVNAHLNAVKKAPAKKATKKAAPAVIPATSKVAELPPAPYTADPNVLLEHFLGGAHPGKAASLRVSYAGMHIGAVHQSFPTGSADGSSTSKGSWTAVGFGSTTVSVPAGASRDEAIKALIDNHANNPYVPPAKKKAAKKKTPPPSAPVSQLPISHIPEDVQKLLFSSYKAQPKGQLISSPTADTYDNLLAVAHVYGHRVPSGLTVGHVAEVVDAQLVKNQGISNSHLLMSKLTTWLGSSEGAAYVKAHKEPKPSIVAALTGKVTLPEGVHLAPGEKVQKVAGPGAYDPHKPATDFIAHTASQMQDLQAKYRANHGIVLTPEQHAALSNYTGGGYSGMNGYLRGEYEFAGPQVKDQVLQVQSAMMPIQQDTLLLRGTNWDQLPEKFRSTELAKKLVGKTIEDPGFMSTAVAGSGGEFPGDVHLTIEAPAGTPGVFVRELSLHKGENEMLLAAGTRFRVISVESPSVYMIAMRLRVVTAK
jgi:hypothetical protein